jgi:precorrin-4 methylase
MNYIREGIISVLKVTFKSALFLFSMYLTLSQSVQTEENYKKEGKVVYQIHYGYKSIYNQLKVNQKEYDQYWKEGLSIAEMAKKQGFQEGIWKTIL